MTTLALAVEGGLLIKLCFVLFCFFSDGVVYSLGREKRNLYRVL